MANPVTHLEKTIAGEVNPVTHLEKVIAEYGGGGGGGTSDYTDLTNKPKINNVELTGNKSLADLGAATQSDMTTVENNILKIYGGLVGKNKLDYDLAYLKTINTAGTWNNNVYVRGNVTYTINADNSITVVSTGAGTAPFFLKTGIYNSYGGDILSGCPANGSDATYQINVEQSAGSYSLLAQDSGRGRVIADNTQQNINIYINCKTSTQTPLTFKPMICSNADWTISHDYQPYTYDMTTISTLLRELINQ